MQENAVPFPTQVDSTIPKLALPEDNTWDVFVTRAVSVTEVCIRFIGDDYSVRLFFLFFNLLFYFFNFVSVSYEVKSFKNEKLRYLFVQFIWFKKHYLVYFCYRDCWTV